MIEPLFNNILIKPRTTESVIQTEGNLTEVGDVLEVGKDVKVIVPGDVIGFSKWGSKKIEKDGEVYHLLPEDGRFALIRFHEKRG